MKKEFREAIRLARAEGVERPYVEGGDPHARLRGLVNGRAFTMVFSATKAFADQRCQMATKLNIRREVRRLREPRTA